MAARTGKVGRLAVTAVAPTSSTDNAATLSTDGVTLVIDSTARRHWDRALSTGLRVWDTSTEISTGDYEPNWVVGQVVFDSARSTSNSYTIDVDYLTASFVGMTRSWQAQVATDIHDVSAFSTLSTADTQWRTVTPGLSGATVTLERFQAHTTGPAFFDRLAAGQETIVELWGDSTDQMKLEGYAYVAEDGWAAPVDDVNAESVTLAISSGLYYSTR
jgi:hypothetical protein